MLHAEEEIRKNSTKWYREKGNRSEQCHYGLSDFLILFFFLSRIYCNGGCCIMQDIDDYIGRMTEDGCSRV